MIFFTLNSCLNLRDFELWASRLCCFVDRICGVICWSSFNSIQLTVLLQAWLCRGKFRDKVKTSSLTLTLSLGGSWADLGCGSLNCQSNVIWKKECSGVFVSVSIHRNSWRLSLYFVFLSEVEHMCFHLGPDGVCLFLIRSIVPFIGYCFIRLLTFYWSLLLKCRPSGCTVFVFIWSQAIT